MKNSRRITLKKIRLLSELASLYRIISRYDIAIEFFLNIIDIAQEHNFIHEYISACGMLGWLYTAKRELEAAIKYFNIALDYHQKNGNELYYGMILGNLGNVYTFMGDYEKAHNYLEERLKISQKYDDKIGIVSAYNDIGILYAQEGDLKTSIKFLEKGLHFLETAEIRDKRWFQNNLNANLGNYYRDVGEFAKAIPLLRDAYKFSKEIGNLLTMMYTNNSLGVCYRELGDYALAEEHFDKALKQAKNINMPQAILSIYQDKCILKINQNQFNDAEIILEDAIHFAEKLQLLDSVRETVIQLYQMLYEKNPSKSLKEKIDAFNAV